jgi:hypothetical protein
MDIFAKSKTWDFPHGIGDGDGTVLRGSYVKYKKGRTVFTYESAGFEGCYAEMMKDNTGYSSQSKPGVYICKVRHEEQKIWATKS